jgi:hypothetical protein
VRMVGDVVRQRRHLQQSLYGTQNFHH